MTRVVLPIGRTAPPVWPPPNPHRARGTPEAVEFTPDGIGLATGVAHGATAKGRPP
jgi:hypothetical protein